MEATALTLHKSRQFEEEKIKTIKCHFKKNKSFVKSVAQPWSACLNVILWVYDVVQPIHGALLYCFTISSHRWDLNVCVCFIWATLCVQRWHLSQPEQRLTPATTSNRIMSGQNTGISVFYKPSRYKVLAKDSTSFVNTSVLCSHGSTFSFPPVTALIDQYTSAIYFCFETAFN